MTIVSLILLFLACLGVTITFVHMEIMDIIKLRPLWEKSAFLKKLFHCSACTGWHVGLWYGLLCYFIMVIGLTHIFYIMTLPFASSAFCFLFERIMILADNVNVKLEKPERKRLTRRTFSGRLKP
jgi:hypothetical protein